MRISDWSSDVCSSDLAVPGNEHDADGKLIAHDITAQTRAVFANVRAVLEASGARWEDLVDVTVYLTDMASDFKAYNAVWAEHFPDPASAPCRTTLGRSEEHTSELQSLMRISYAVFCLKKKNKN